MKGRAADLMPIIDELKANGRSLAQIAKELNARGIKHFREAANGKQRRSRALLRTTR